MLVILLIAQYVITPANKDNAKKDRYTGNGPVPIKIETKPSIRSKYKRTSANTRNAPISEYFIIKI